MGSGMSDGHWRPASGYMTETGRSKWRCWNETRPVGHKEHSRRDGKTWLCDSQEAAQRKCDELNAEVSA